MPVSRMRMRPWLEMMIESKKISGLTWVDEDKTMFTIPWKHAARHGWEMDKDACLFKQWAIHTGKYVEGQDSDPKTWKANFRCAMNSLPDIEEVKHKSINKGHQAMRVFRMLPPTQKSKVKRSRMKTAKNDEMRKYKMEESDYSDSQSPMSSSSEEAESTQESTVDSTVTTELAGYTVAAEVPDWSHSVEIGAGDSMYYPRFEVSPEHYNSTEEESYIMEICEQLEREANATFNMLNNGSFLSNGPGTSPSMSSSDSSVGDIDELPSYINLGAGSSPFSSMWDSFHPVAS